MSMAAATYNQRKEASNENGKPIQRSSAARASTAKHPHPGEIIQRARMNPDSLTQGDVMQLQNTVGNRAVIQLLSELQSTRRSQEEKNPVQLKKAEELKAKTPGENKTGMPENLRTGLETLSNMDLSGLRVHYNSDKPKTVGALAYTQGTDIHIAPGQEKHLPHEGWHVVQQRQGRVKPTLQLKTGVKVNDDAGLEKEADVMGSKAALIQKYAAPSLIRKSKQGNVIQLQAFPAVYSGSYEGKVIQLAKQKNKAVETALDILQTVLDIVGFIPGIGDVADAMNVIVSLIRGDLVSAAFSAIAIIPVVGSAVAFPLKTIYRALSNFNTIRKAVDILLGLFKNTKKIISVVDDVYKGAVTFVRKIPGAVSSLADNWLVKIAVGKGKIADLADAARKGISSFISKIDEIIDSVKTAIKKVTGDASDVRHAVKNPNDAQNILNGIDPKYFNPKSRFGGGFYVAEDGMTAVKELEEHGFQATHSIRYNIDMSNQKVLDLTNPKVAQKWGFSKGLPTDACQAIGEKARAQGFSAIKFPSYRGAGNNYVIYNNFNKILSPKMVSPVK